MYAILKYDTKYLFSGTLDDKIAIYLQLQLKSFYNSILRGILRDVSIISCEYFIVIVLVF